jgi:hypothetical protein
MAARGCAAFFLRNGDATVAVRCDPQSISFVTAARQMSGASDIS